MDKACSGPYGHLVVKTLATASGHGLGWPMWPLYGEEPGLLYVGIVWAGAHMGKTQAIDP